MDFLAIDKIQNPHVMAEQTLLDNISLYVFFYLVLTRKSWFKILFIVSYSNICDQLFMF